MKNVTRNMDFLHNLNCFILQVDFLIYFSHTIRTQCFDVLSCLLALPCFNYNTNNFVLFSNIVIIENILFLSMTTFIFDIFSNFNLSYYFSSFFTPMLIILII